MKEQLEKFLESLYPVKTKFDLIRIGGNNDGGYLVPDDLEGITACFSPGVAETATFEEDLSKRGIASHLADASVDGPPANFTPASFEKKFLGATNEGNYITLDDWTRRCGGYLGDWILQMDIEGGEYATILSASTDTLRRFRIMCIEIHHAECWFTPLAWDAVRVFFDKILKDFHVVHNHPNNNCPFIEVEGIMLPTVFEMTFLRKDRSNDNGWVTEYPHDLDQPNVLDKPDYPLPSALFGA